MNNQLIIFLKKLNVQFKKISLYEQALTHPSFSNEKNVDSYQRLEFLGDAILEAFATEYVYNYFPKFDEGAMTIIRSKAVSGELLANFAKKIKLDDQIRFGNKSEILKDSQKILADIFEAFVAALYLDLGKEETMKFLNSNVFKFIRESKNKELKNPKTILQELLQSISRESIEYKVYDAKNGFEAIVYYEGKIFGKGLGATKKEAEVKAAENSLKLLKR